MSQPSCHVFKCYLDSTDDCVIVEAASHREAARAAASERGWPCREVVTRYLVTRSAGKCVGLRQCCRSCRVRICFAPITRKRESRSTTARL